MLTRRRRRRRRDSHAALSHHSDTNTASALASCAVTRATRHGPHPGAPTCATKNASAGMTVCGALANAVERLSGSAGTIATHHHTPTGVVRSAQRAATPREVAAAAVAAAAARTPRRGRRVTRAVRLPHCLHATTLRAQPS